MKTVEDASESAAAATFGGKHGRVRNGRMDRPTADAAISDMHIHDAAYNEGTDMSSTTEGGILISFRLVRN